MLPATCPWEGRVFVLLARICDATGTTYGRYTYAVISFDVIAG